MATNGPKFLLAVFCAFFILQTECAPGHGKNNKNCDLPVLLTQLRNEVHQEQRNPITYAPAQHIPELLSEISDILTQSGQGDVIASNLGSGVNNVQDSTINVAKNGNGGGGDFIASNSGSGVNNVEGSQINVMNGAAYTPLPQYSYSPNFQGDVTASNMGSGVNNVKDSTINIAKNGYGSSGDFIASNVGSGVNNVEGSAINVMKGPAMIQSQYNPAAFISNAAQYQGDVIASNMGSGTNNVKDSLINVAKTGYEGAGDFIASNVGSGVNNVEGSAINVMKGPAFVQQPFLSQASVNSYVPQYQGDVIASNIGSGVNNVKDSQINVAKNEYGGAGDFIASNLGSGVNNVEGSEINVMKKSAVVQPQYLQPSFAPAAYATQYQGDVIASNMGSGVNNVKDSTINVAKNGYGGAGDFIASNLGSGVNNVEGSEINVMKGAGIVQQPQYIQSSFAPKVDAYQYQGDVIASNIGSGVNNVKDSLINIAKNGYGGAGDFIASNAGSGVNNVEGSAINVMKEASTFAPQYGYSQQYQGDVIASNMGSGVNNVLDSQINVVKDGYGRSGDFIASNAGSGVNNVESSEINVMKGPTTYAPQFAYNTYAPQYQGDVIASNMGSGVNNVKDSQINVAKNGYGGAGDFIASNAGYGVNNVEGSSINVMKQQPQYITTTYAPQFAGNSYVSQYQGDVIASNMGAGVNNVKDSLINVAKNGYGGAGDFIASNAGSGVNNVEGSEINVMKGPAIVQPFYSKSAVAFNTPQYQGDVIASNLGAGINNVKDSLINVAKDGYGGSGDFIASNAGSGTNNVEGSSINVMKQQSYFKPTTYAPQYAQTTYAARPTYIPFYQGDVIASNMGSGVNNVKDSKINVAKNGYAGAGDFIASNLGSGVNNVEGSEINVMKQQFAQTTTAPRISQKGTLQVIPSAIGTSHGNIIGSNTGSGVNNVQNSDIFVVQDQQGGDIIASNTGSGTNNVQDSKISVMGGNQSPAYTARPVTLFEEMGTANINGHHVPVVKQEHGDIIASNLGSGVNNVKDSSILVVKDEANSGSDVIASNMGSGVNNVERSSINVMKGQNTHISNDNEILAHFVSTHQSNSYQSSGDVIASNLGSGVNNVKDSNIMVSKEGASSGDFIASNAGSGVNNVEGSNINVYKNSATSRPLYIEPVTVYENIGSINFAGHNIPVMIQEQGDIIASNMGSGVNNVKDSQINVAKNGYGGAGDFIASNAGSGVNNVENSEINVMKQYASTFKPVTQQSYAQIQTQSERPRKGSLQVIPSAYGTARGDVIGSNTGSGVNNVQDSDILVVKDDQGGNVIASNTGSGTNNVQGSKISVMGGNQQPAYTARPITIYEKMGTANVNGHHIPVVKQEHGDIIASNLGSGVNNVKDSTINVMKNAGSGGDFIASNSGSGVNNVEGSQINVMNGASSSAYQTGDVIASNMGSGVNSVLDSEINVVKNGAGGGDFIASNAGSGVNNVESSQINVMKNQKYTPSIAAPTFFQHYVAKNTGSMPVQSYQQRGDVIASNIGSGVNNVQDSEIVVVNDQPGGNIIASNTGSGTNNVQNSKINVLGGGNQQPMYTAMPITVYEQMGTANIHGHHVPVVKQEHGDIIASNLGSGVNNVKDSSIVVMKDGSSGGDFIASNAGSGVNNVEGSSINVMKGQSAIVQQEEEESCDDLHDSDMLNVKDILKTILFGETSNTRTTSLNTVGVVLNKINNLQRLKNILKTIHPKYNWNISDKVLKQDILTVLAHPKNNVFSKFINGLYNYKLNANGGMNALFHLIGYTTPEASRQFDLNVVLNTVYPGRSTNIVSQSSSFGHTNMLQSGETNIFNQANKYGHLNTLNAGSTDIKNQKSFNSHINTLKNEKTNILNHAYANKHLNTLRTENTDIMNHKTTNGHINTLKTENTNIFNQAQGNSHLNTLNTGNTDIMNHHSLNGHVNTLKTEDTSIFNQAHGNSHLNTLNTGSTDIMNQKSMNGHINTLKTDDTNIFNQVHSNGHFNALNTGNTAITNQKSSNTLTTNPMVLNPDIPGCELFQFLRSKFPKINEKYIENAVLSTVSNYINTNKLYNQAVRVARSVESN